MRGSPGKMRRLHVLGTDVTVNSERHDENQLGTCHKETPTDRHPLGDRRYQASDRGVVASYTLHACDETAQSATDAPERDPTVVAVRTGEAVGGRHRGDRAAHSPRPPSRTAADVTCIRRRQPGRCICGWRSRGMRPAIRDRSRTARNFRCLFLRHAQQRHRRLSRPRHSRRRPSSRPRGRHTVSDHRARAERLCAVYSHRRSTVSPSLAGLPRRAASRIQIGLMNSQLP